MSEREMQQIIESMEGMVVSALGVLGRQEHGSDTDEGIPEIPVSGLDEMAMGQASFDKLLGKMLLSSLWDRMMSDLEKRGFDSIAVQEQLMDYFTVVMKRYFSGKGVGTATVKPYEDYWLSMQKRDPVLKGKEPNYSGIASPQVWDKLFDKLFDSKEFEHVLFRYGKNPKDPDSTLDPESAKRVLRHGMYTIAKRYFGRGGQVAIQPAAAGESVEESVSESLLNRLMDAMIMSPRVERIMALVAGEQDPALISDGLRTVILQVVKKFLMDQGIKTQGAAQA
ncbi:MAG: hypothetical protein JW704_11895, partial [Anaerolineaceae bacterium]|nr:hypothetical protein [Anaerolineaceae bacterium]